MGLRKRFSNILDIFIGLNLIIIFLMSLTGGFRVYLGSYRISFHHFKNPLILLLTFFLAKIFLRGKIKDLGFLKEGPLKLSAKYIFFLIFIPVFSLYMSNGKTLVSSDTIPTRFLPASILHERDLDLDEFLEQIGNKKFYFLREIRGHYFSNFPLAPGIIGVPVHFFSDLLTGDHSYSSYIKQEKITAALIASLSVIFLFLASRQLTSLKYALILTLFYALGTSSWSTSSQAMWQHGPAQLFLAMTTYFLIKGSTGKGYAGWAGFSIMAATSCRPIMIIAVLITLLYVWHQERGKMFPFLLGTLPGIIFLLWSNLAIYQHLLGPYSHVSSMPGKWDSPLLPTFLAQLINPNRGLFIFSPLLIFSPLGMVYYWKRRDPLFICFSFIVIFYFLIISKFTHWWGGWSYGPRLSADILPLLVLFLVPVLENFYARGWFKMLFFLLSILSIANHSIGVYFEEPYLWNARPNIDQFPERLKCWKDSQILSVLNAKLLFPDEFNSAKMYKTTGEEISDNKINSCFRVVRYASDRLHEPGYITLGPLSGFPPGSYSARFSIKAKMYSYSTMPVAILDIVGEFGHKVYASRKVYPSDFNKQDGYKYFALGFYLPKGEKRIEFRVYYPGKGELWSDKIIVSRNLE